MTGRIVIDDIRPATPTRRYPAKAVVGERVTVSAVIFRDGHDILAAQVRFGPAGPDGLEPGDQVVAMVDLANGKDEWRASVRPAAVGPGQLVIEAWTDSQATWAHRAQAKLDAGQDIEVELAEGVRLFKARDPGHGPIHAALVALGRGEVELALATPLPGPDGARDLTVSDPVPLWVDRPRALFGAWYELFPRSYGGFKGTEERLPAVAAMGFDVLYLPPIHPIGTTARKGPDNTVSGGVDAHGRSWPGSPWAIGSLDGGHTAIDPDLGTFDDFSHLLDAVADVGMEVALDYALQCSPDHPWVDEHPEWFHHRPDGSIAYAENPPKKYQDIYPINFWPDSDADRQALWDACRDIFEFWIARGVAIFRVDNPHTKPIAFWEWVIADVRSRHPETLFLAEAFTRPRVMAKLAEIGFSQSYTYFTWRTEQHGPEGIRAYLNELTGQLADYMRPSFWPSTPDILSGPLRDGPPAAFAERLVLAATLAPSWGMYSGFELYENEPASPSNEEYLHSEKFEIRRREFDRPDSLAPLIGAINAIRRRHPALQRLRGTVFHRTDNPSIVAYSKVDDDGDDVMLVVVSLDPHHMQHTRLTLDLAGLGLPTDQPYLAHDVLSGDTYQWFGPNPYVRLEPWARLAHIIHFPAARPPVGGAG